MKIILISKLYCNVKIFLALPGAYICNSREQIINKHFKHLVTALGSYKILLDSKRRDFCQIYLRICLMKKVSSFVRKEIFILWKRLKQSTQRRFMDSQIVLEWLYWLWNRGKNLARPCLLSWQNMILQSESQSQHEQLFKYLG